MARTKGEKLTPRQQIFCIEYVKTSNGTQAAITAGYSEDSARAIASENLTKPHILAEIHRLQENVELDLRIFFKQHAFEAFQDLLSIKQQLADPNLKLVKVLHDGKLKKYKANDPALMRLRAEIDEKILNYAGYKPKDSLDLNVGKRLEDFIDK